MVRSGHVRNTGRTRAIPHSRHRAHRLRPPQAPGDRQEPRPDDGRVPQGLDRLPAHHRGGGRGREPRDQASPRRRCRPRGRRTPQRRPRRRRPPSHTVEREPDERRHAIEPELARRIRPSTRLQPAIPTRCRSWSTWTSSGCASSTRWWRSAWASRVGWSFHEEIFHVLTQPLRKVPFPDVKFIFTGPSEALMLYMKMSFFAGIFLAAPYILYQVWAFISPGLYTHEKVYVVPVRRSWARSSSRRRRLRPLLLVPDHVPLPRPASAARTCSSCRRSTSTSPSTRGSCSASEPCSRLPVHHLHPLPDRPRHARASCSGSGSGRSSARSSSPRSSRRRPTW